MKKLALLLLLLSTPCYANTVSLHTVSNDNTLTAINDNFSNVANRLNGDIDGSTDGGSTVSNIQADSLYEINMADDANPRLRDSELLNITYDTSSGGQLTQGGVVESGCVPADDTDLTSDISACVAYINGYRVSKSATAQTYTASRDNYLDLSQTGVYTNTAVTNGATAPAVAANSVRLAKVVTDGTEITTITSLYSTRIPGLIIPANYRSGLVVSRDSTTTLVIRPGSAEINNSIVTKTASTTLTISTAGDWAGGSSLRAADTFAFVGLDSSGNLKLHTTAPTHDNYAVSTTDGKKRYATWSSTVYRILGWFYMDGAGSALIDTASNIKEGDVPNLVASHDVNFASFAGTTYATNNRFGGIRFYSSGGPVKHFYVMSGDSSAQFNRLDTTIFSGSTQLTESEKSQASMGGAGVNTTVSNSYAEAGTTNTPPQGSRTYSVAVKVNSDTLTKKRFTYFVEEA